MTEPRTPRTEAGRKLLALKYPPSESYIGRDSLLRGILAIEAEAGAAAPIDVERLGRAMENHVAERVGLNEDHTCERECGPLIAVEYARLSAPPPEPKP